MVSKLIVLVALVSACSAFILPQPDFDERTFFLEPDVIVHPAILITHALPNEETNVVVLPSEEELVRSKRQTDRREPMPSGQRGQIEVYGERNRGGTDFGAQATGRLWESRDGRSTVDANANYQRHFGGPSVPLLLVGHGTEEELHPIRDNDCKWTYNFKVNFEPPTLFSTRNALLS